MDLGITRLLSGAMIRARDELLTDELTKKLGYSFALWLSERQGVTPDQLSVAVGCDSRPSGARLMRAFIHGLTQADADVFDCGMATTPAMQLSTQLSDVCASGSVMITASARESGMNGFKFFTPDGAVTAEDVAVILERAANAVVPHRLVKNLNLMDAYCERLKAQIMEFMGGDVALPLLGLHVVVDASGGACGFYADLLASLGADTTGSLNLKPDGLFKAHAPSPESEEALKALSEAVIQNGADVGVIFDADGDRVAIVDKSGKALNKNRLIALIAAILLDDEKNLTFVTDSVTSSGLSRFITEWGGTHYRYRRGYRNVIEEARRLSDEGFNVPVAIETSGHAAMAENYFIDDGMYLATKVICETMWRKRDGLTLASLIDELSEPVESVEVRLPIIQEDYRKAAGYVIEAILSRTLVNPNWRLAPDNREGVRILFSLDGGVDNAWFMLRLSVHDPVMPVNAESDVPGGLRRILNELYAVLEKDNEELDLTPLRAAIDQLETE
ncbi:MAG: phosphomannomutase/phosphoglucomutase [Clostridia bacterium]|nr:phosphomannomutase/phosphoglucomutase [Clostridia bacterium]